MSTFRDESSSSAGSKTPTFWTWVGRCALGLVVAMAIARTTMFEYLRDPFAVTPGSPAVARATGPGTTLVLDLLAAVPALMVLARAAFDRSFNLRRSWGNVVMALLAVFIALSVTWADDRFAAAVDAATICAALASLWATQQLVRTWRHVRVIAAVAFGVLLIYAAHGLIDRLVELPARQENFVRNLTETLNNLRIEPGSFEANRLAQKINGGELLGFGASINTFAAVMVLAAIVAVGALIQRIKDRQQPAAAVASVVLLIASAVVLKWTDSRTAFATPFLAAILFGVVALAGPLLNAHRRLALAAALVMIAGVTTFLIHHGLKTGTMFQDSLNFRWRYWVGAWGVWLERPLRGVGLDGFGLHYVTHRLPIASEEVKDPHNFVVRAFAELGVIGGLLTLLWVGRAAWEMTKPAKLSPLPITNMGTELSDLNKGAAVPYRAVPDDRRRSPEDRFHRDPLSDFSKIAILFAAATLIEVIASVDFAALDANAFIEVLKRLLYLCVGVIGGAIVALQSMERQRIDDRPAPWIRAALTIGVGIFVLHNLVDFSMFETSAMFFAALMAGAAWGVGMGDRPTRRAITIIQFVIAVMVWLGVAIAVVLPILIAESAAANGDALLRDSQFRTAADAYKAALQQWPSNADYAYRAATALALAPQTDRHEVSSLLDAAIAANPMNPKYYRVRAEFVESVGDSASQLIICTNFAKALRIDPASVDIRLEFADTLAQMGNIEDAKDQYEKALSYDGQLDPDDPKRLSAKRVDEIRQHFERVKSIKQNE